MAIKGRRWFRRIAQLSHRLLSDEGGQFIYRVPTSVIPPTNPLFDWGGVAYKTLEIIQPKIGMPANHRMYYAYPGLLYEVRVAAIGGVYPYFYEITNSVPIDLTINSATGKITWISPTGSSQAVSLRVTDTKGNTTTSSYTITVGTSGWIFLDAVNGNQFPVGTGTIGNPFATLSDIFLHTTQGQRVFVRQGNYNFTSIPKLGVICDPGNMIGDQINLVSTVMADVWIKYPNDTAPVINFGGQTCATGCIISWSGDTLWIDGFNCRNGFWKFFNGGGGTNGGGTFYRNEFHEYGSGSSNSSFLMWNHANPITQGCIIQDNYFHNDDSAIPADVNGGLGVLMYDMNKAVIESNTFYRMNGPASPKAGQVAFTIRGNTATSFIGNSAHFLSTNMNDYTFTSTPASGEFCFNNMIGPFNFDDPNVDIGCFELGPTWINAPNIIAAYRNTMNGIIGCSQFGSSGAGGPYVFFRNVIINSDTATVPYTHFREISGFNAPNWTLVQDTENLKGVIADNIIDQTSGILLGTYATSYLYYRGYQIP